MSLGEKLQYLRKTKNMSQEQFAAQLNVSRQAVSKWELGESLPDTDKIILISRILGVSADYLLNDDIENEVNINTNENSNTNANININGHETYEQPYMMNGRHGNMFDSIMSLIKRKGYIAGYIISGYSVGVFLMMRFAHFAFKKILTPFGDFDNSYYEIPEAMKVPLYFTNGISVIAVIAFIGGIIFAIYFKRKGNK